MRYKFLKLFLFFLLTLIISPVFAAEKVLYRGNSTEPGTLDPHRMSDLYQHNIGIDLFEGLLADDAKGEKKPGVAASWDISDDGLVYTFHLRENAKWSDGTPITARDFLYSFHRMLDPKFAAEYAWMLYPIKNAQEYNTGKAKKEDLAVKVIDDYTLEVTLKAPTAYFLAALTHYAAWPVPQHVIEKYGDNWTKPGNMVSNGAYYLKDWKPQEHVLIVKNPHYYEADQVAIDKIYYDPTEDKKTAYRKYQAGQLHIIEQISPEVMNLAKKEYAEDIQTHLGATVYYLTFNLKKKPFDDIRIRRALSMAIDRDVIVDKINQRGDVPAYGFVPQVTEEYTQAKADFADIKQKERDEEARRLLKEAGFDKNNPLKFELTYNTSSINERVMIAIAGMWRQKLGVEAQLLNRETAVHYNELKAATHEMARAGWVADYMDPQNYLVLHHSTKSGAFNYSQYNNPEYDKLIDASDYEQDAKKRFQLLHEAENILMQDMPVIPVYFYVDPWLVSKKVEGWIGNTANRHPSRYLDIKK